MRTSRSCLGFVTCVAVALPMAACASAAVGEGDPFVDPTYAPEYGAEQGTPDVIVRAEILDRGGSDHTAMALIRRLRPAWLLSRGQDSFNDPAASYPVVYIDEIRHGGLDTLHHIPASEILRMQFYGTADATTRWGTGHPSGAINIITGR